MLRAGTLRHRITIQRPGDAEDEYGQPIPGADAYEDVATVWAAIRPVGSNERLAASQMQSGQTHVITARYQKSLAAAKGSWRIAFKGRFFGLVGLPRNLDEGNHTLLFDCTEKVNG